MRSGQFWRGGYCRLYSLVLLPLLVMLAAPRPAFPSLVGRATQLTPAQMQRFATFILQVTLPPNPNRALDNSLTAAQQTGRDFFMGSVPTDTLQPCHGCHALDPANGHFGTDGFSSFENETQDLKIPRLRNLYQKVGMFGMPSASEFINPGNNGPQGPQVRGFGFLHDGSVDTLFRFHNATVFNGGFPSGAAGETQRRDVEQFMLAFDSDMKPAVGQEITLTSGNASIVGSRLDLLITRAQAGDCDLVVKGNAAGLQRGWYRQSNGTFRSDRFSEPPLSDTQLRTLATTPGQELTYLCVSPGGGVRIGVDRDEDGYFDRDELDAGTDPANPLSYPGAPTATPTKDPIAIATATPTGNPCVGDCDGSGAVTVDEILTLVNMALGNGGTCLSGLAAGVTPDVSVILQAVNNALDGCSPLPTLTSTPTTPTKTYTPTPTGTATVTNTPASNPAAYLKLDDPAGATTFADSSGSNHPGSCSDGACPTLGVAGEFGTAAFFSTSGSAAYVIDIPNMSPTPGTFSYILWVKTTGSAGTAGTMGLIHIGSVASEWSDQLVLDHGTPRVDIWNGSAIKTAWAAAAVQNNAWYCVAATSNANGSINVYVNGTQGSSVAVGGDSNSLPSDFHLGMQSSGPGALGTGYFYGTIDEVRIYPFELSASEISTLCATPTPTPTA